MSQPMSQLDILIHVRDAESESLAARAGFALAQRLQAFLYGLYVAPMGTVVFSTPETVVFQAQEADHFYNKALARQGWWQAQLDTHKAAGEWLVAQGEPVESLCHAARWCDLVVVERPTLHPDAPTGWGIVSRTVFGVSTPVLVVPQAARIETLAERITIAWNHSREAMRAIHGALPLLRLAAKTVVLDGSQQDDLIGARHLPQLDLQKYLVRHGVTAEFRAFTPKKDSGTAILAAAHEMQADMIVMGAWGHSRIAELVLGGATRYLFQHSNLPLFVVH